MFKSNDSDDEIPGPTARGEAAPPPRHGHELQRPGHQRAEEGQTREDPATVGRALRRRAEPGYSE